MIQVTYANFRHVLKAFQKNNKNTDLMTSVKGYKPAYKQSFFLSNNRQSGYSLVNGEIVLLYSNDKTGSTTLKHAIKQGGKRLNCFDGNLVDFYKRHGFKESIREANWIKGGPDIIYMYV